MVVHRTSNGGNLRACDLLGSGTLSGTERGTGGCALEMTRGGQEPVMLANGETRRYLEHGGEAIFRAHCRRDGHVPIGFGECRGAGSAGATAIRRRGPVAITRRSGGEGE